jgi:hypothetical protein
MAKGDDMPTDSAGMATSNAAPYAQEDRAEISWRSPEEVNDAQLTSSRRPRAGETRGAPEHRPPLVGRGWPARETRR